jgi:hypothetical protein
MIMASVYFKGDRPELVPVTWPKRTRRGQFTATVTADGGGYCKGDHLIAPVEQFVVSAYRGICQWEPRR